MHTSSACKREVTRVSDVCMEMCRESDNIGSLHFFMHTLVIVQLSSACKREVTRVSDVCMEMCRESDNIGSLHFFMHTLVIVPTAQLHEHIRQSVHCTFTSTHQVHVNVQRPECVTCACKCAERQTIGSQHIFMHTSVIVLTAQLSNISDSLITAHLHARINCM